MNMNFFRVHTEWPVAKPNFSGPRFLKMTRISGSRPPKEKKLGLNFVKHKTKKYAEVRGGVANSPGVGVSRRIRGRPQTTGGETRL